MILIKNLAAEMLSYMKQKAKPTGKDYWHLDGTAKPWMASAVRDAHDDMLPNDIKYAFIAECLYSIVDEGPEYEIETSVHTSELTEWLASSLSRVELVNEAANEGLGLGKDLHSALSMGQWLEKDRVRQSLVLSLTNQAHMSS